MGKIKPTHLLETAIWLFIAAFGYYYSFKFDAPIEIYKFGASGWPRAILALIVIAAFGNLFWHYLHGDDSDDITRLNQEFGTGADITSDVAAPHVAPEPRRSYYLRIIPIIALPFLYGYFLEGVGFYSLTPPFIALIIFVMGERSLGWLFGITALIYGLLLFLFAKVLFVGLPVGNWHPFYDYGQWLIPAIQNSYILEFLGLAIVIPLAIYALTHAKETGAPRGALGKSVAIYAAMLTLGTAAAYLLSGGTKTFILFDVLIWPLRVLF